MFDNFLLITIVIIVMWIAALVFYLVTSRGQGDLQDSIEKLSGMLDKSNHQDS